MVTLEWDGAKPMNINQRVNGSWLDIDAFRHWCYERIYQCLSANELPGKLMAIEFGSLQPTTPPLRILKNIYGDRVDIMVGKPYPEDDVTAPLNYGPEFDFVIADQVLEHVTDPQEAILNLGYLLKPNGLLIVAMPFLYPVHNCPVDVSRLTPYGLERLIEGDPESPNPFDIIEVDSWGGKEIYRWWLDHLLDWVPFERAMSECPGFSTPEYGGTWPMIVWAIARKR